MAGTQSRLEPKLDSLLLNMDRMLSDDSNLACCQKAAILVDDTLLRLKVWRDETGSDTIRALDEAIEDGALSGLHNMILVQLDRISDSIEELDAGCGDNNEM